LAAHSLSKLRKIMGRRKEDHVAQHSEAFRSEQDEHAADWIAYSRSQILGIERLRLGSARYGSNREVVLES
jgi:hypothetical protein